MVGIVGNNGGISSITANRALSNLANVAINNALAFDPGSDADMDLIKVNVTGIPKLWWDEVTDSFEMNKSLTLPGGSLRVGSHVLSETTDEDDDGFDIPGSLHIHNYPGGIAGNITLYEGTEPVTGISGNAHRLWVDTNHDFHWQNHLGNSYLIHHTGVSIADAYIASAANWNIAYGWGNHAGLYDVSGVASGLMTAHETIYNHINYDIAYTHSQNNSQAHLDYLVNNANDITTGRLTASGFTSTSNVVTSILESASGVLKLQANANNDVTLFSSSDVGDAEDGKELKIWRNAAEGNNYIRAYVNAAQNAMIHASTSIILQNGSPNNIQLNSGQHIYFNLGDALGADEVRIRNSSAVEVMTINSLGYMTLAGAIKDRLHVQGSEAVGGLNATIELENTAAGGDRWFLRAGATGTPTPAGGFSIADTTAYRFVINENGNVGINTMTSNQKLHVLASGTSTYTNAFNRGILITDSLGPRLVFEDSGEGTGDKVMSIKYENERLIISSLNDEGSSWDVENILVMNRDGFVGIGTPNPGLPLDVRNTDDNLAFFFDTRAQAAGTGGGIAFGGKYTDAGEEAMSGRIGTKKTNSTSGHVGFDMVIETQDSVGSIQERIKFTSDAKTFVRGELTVEDSILVSGTVDGRNVATDGAKLDGVSSGAEVSTKEEFISAGAAILSSNASYDTPNNTYQLSLADAVSFARCFFVFRLPADFSSMASGYPKVAFKQGTGGTGNYRIAFNGRAGSAGESMGGSLDSIAEYTMPGPGNTNLWEEDISACFDGLSLAAGDYVGLQIQRDSDDSLDTFVGDLDVVGIAVKYI